VPGSAYLFVTTIVVDFNLVDQLKRELALGGKIDFGYVLATAKASGR
jgi:hypothetical protein